jgi:formylmethanofuran dehydrogenase subunit E
MDIMMKYREIIKFHGHECPGLAIGYRMASTGLKAIESVRAEDEELVSIVENDACGVDALQCVTGCTLGKGNLIFRDYGKHVFTIYSRSTRKGVRVVFLGQNVPDNVSKDRKIFTEWILSAPQEAILSVTSVSVPEPEPAKIRDSVPCTICDETVMESRLRNMDGKSVCIPCFEKHQSIKQSPTHDG